LSDARPGTRDDDQRAERIEFAAQEYTPTRDFEVVVETAGGQDDVVVIPHRRLEGTMTHERQSACFAPLPNVAVCDVECEWLFE